MYLYMVKTERLFVYGTLRKGGTAHELMSNCTLLEAGVRVTGFKLYDAGEYPFAWYTSDPEDTITGDLFELNEGILPVLDEYEGDEYQRIVLPALECYIYVIKNDKAPLLPVIYGGDWLLYKK
jgi:gamma-glutamylcyclotransferase (GGCT)/AIG2-like uncharacterized protein YtfP